MNLDFQKRRIKQLIENRVVSQISQVSLTKEKIKVKSIQTINPKTLLEDRIKVRDMGPVIKQHFDLKSFDADI